MVDMEMSSRWQKIKHTFTTREGWLGDYDYGFLMKPQLPFMKRDRRIAPFYGINQSMPIVLALLLGFQHALAMLGGLVTPPLILGGAGGANLTTAQQQYLVSASLIVCGMLSAVQITRFKIKGTPYYIGTGLLSVVGTSFATISIATGTFSQMYARGYCPIDPDTGLKLPCPQGYGALIGTAALCSLTEIGMSFLPARVLKRTFPPIVTGPVVMLIGVHLVETGLQGWAGGAGLCLNRATNAAGQMFLCGTAKPLPWGDARFIGLGFSVFATIILVERFGSPIMKSAAVVMGLIMGMIISGATGYWDRSTIDSAPAATFIWTHTFPLTIYAPLILPLMAVYVILAMEAIGDISATCDVSRIEVEGPEFDSRIQGGVLSDGFNGLLAALMTMTPLSCFAQNNGVIALTRCANRTAGYCCCMFLFLMGVFAKFGAVFVAIPASVLGGMTTFLFCSVAVSGMRIIALVPFNRRNRFILTAALALGFGAVLVPNYFSYVFTYEGSNHALRGFYDAIELVMGTGFAVAALISIFLNLVLPAEMEEEKEAVVVVGTHAEGNGVASMEEDVEMQKISESGKGIMR
ncbi:hypothetical protein YB2330_000125 [Saitoella coloradoensis]